MKTLLNSVVLWLVFTAFSVFGQVPDARAFYEAHRHEIIDAPSLAQTQSKSPNKALFVIPAPGDGAKFATLKINMSFAEPGDRVVAKLIGLAPQGEFNIVGRRTYYNEQERQNRFEFFTPTVCGSRGYCRGGLDAYQTLEVFSTQISESDGPGLYIIDFVIYEVGSGRLRQQIFTNYYVNRAPEWGRDFFRVESAKLVMDGAGPHFILFGSFPKDQDAEIWFGSGGEGFATKGTYQSLDGRSILIDGSIIPARDTSIDFVLLYPGMRTAMTLPKALVLPAMQNNNVAISVPTITAP